MRLAKATPKAIKAAAALLRRGGLVAFPTETVYGLGADALNPRAVARVFEAKGRPRFDPLIVHVADLPTAERLCAAMDERARRLAARFWPGPLTLVLPKSALVPDIVTAGLPTVAVRMPSHPVARRLIREAGTPVAAPSANPFGYLSPTTAGHVREQLGGRVDLILDGGRCPVGVESTVVSLAGKTPTLLRPGGLPVEEVERVIGRVEAPRRARRRPLSPGQLPRHYSPQTPIRILRPGAGKAPPGRRVGLLAFRAPRGGGPYARVEVLSPAGDLREAAANFFSCLHRLDGAGLDVIYAEPVPEVGLGRAIMDRLYRAAGARRRVAGRPARFA